MVPAVIGALLYAALSTWKKGRRAARLAHRRTAVSTRRISSTRSPRRPPHRVPGTAIFMTSNRGGDAANAVAQSRAQQGAARTCHSADRRDERRPHVEAGDRVGVEPLRAGILESDGFATASWKNPISRRRWREAASCGLPIAPQDTTYFLGTETLLATKRPGMPLWRERLFVLMSRNALRATSFFKIPPDRVMEVGMQVEL